MADDTERDERALTARLEGQSFVAIADDLSFANAREALGAYRRAVLRRPLAEQKSIRAGERKRFEAKKKAVKANSKLSPEDVEKRLARIERLSAALG